MKSSVIDAIKTALENMDRKYYELSRTVHGGRNPEKKYLERPFTYEFYHQFRKLIDKGKADFCLGPQADEPSTQADEPSIQAEVAKSYQHYFDKGCIPDFIIHVPNTNTNIAVLEFKLAPDGSHFNRNFNTEIEEDFKKLVEFKRRLHYEYLIEVVIGDAASLRKARECIKRISSTRNGESITIIEFNVETQKAREWQIKYATSPDSRSHTSRRLNRHTHNKKSA